MATLNTSDLNRQGKVFSGANLASANHIAVTTAMTGLILANPFGSGKKLVLIDVGFVWVTAPAAVHNLALAVAAPTVLLATSLTAITIQAADCSGTGTGSVAKLWNAATFVTAPIISRWIGGGVYGSGVGESPFMIQDKVEGAVVVVPGAAVMTAAVTTTLAGMASFTWAELNA